MKSQMTIGKKLTLAFAALVALLMGLGYSGLSAVSNLGGALDVEINKTAKKTELAEALVAGAFEMRAAQRGIIVYAMMKNPTKIDQNKELYRSGAEDLIKSLAEIRQLVVKPAARQAIDEIQAGFDAWQPLYAEIVKNCENHHFDGDFPKLLDATGVSMKQIQTASTKLLQVQKETQAEAAVGAVATVASSRWIAFALIGIGLAIGGIVLWVVRNISAVLRRLAGELGEGADQTANAASEVSSSSQSLAQGSSEQAASLEETSASSEEINSMARKNTENSRTAADLVTQSQQKFVETNQALEQTVAAMGDINAQSGKISKIIKVIDEIAFQTNILALNAAVEAARAGEAGMGFAVVADEVRNLAQRCAQAAKDTAELIEESIAKSNDGKVKVDQVAGAIRSITEESAKVKTLVDEVNLGSQEQARGIEQIAKAITQMEQVTQKTAANAEESAAASEELNAQSETLKDIVARLSAMVGGGEAHVVRKAPVKHHAAPARNDRKASPQPVMAASKSNPFPMDDEFKEF